MFEVEFTEASFENPAHREAIITLVDSYARDPEGNRHQLPLSVRENLIPGLRDHPSSWVLLAIHKERPIGMVVCFVGFSTFKARPLINIHDLVVLAEFRKQGVGRRLLEEVESKARELGCCKLTLEVREKNNGARKLYQNVGFGYSRDGSELERTLFLEKYLT